MKSRAVLRPVEPSSRANPEAVCAACNDRIVFSRHRPKRIIANVYENGVWSGTLQFHPEHYDGRFGDAEG